MERVKVTYDAMGQELVIEQNGRTKGYIGSVAGQKLITLMADDNVDITIIDNDEAYRRKLNRTLHYHLTQRAVDRTLYLTLLAQYGVESSTQLSSEEMEELIEDVKCLQTPEDVRKVRSSILCILDQLGIRGSYETGWQVVNDYLRQPRIAGKTLYEMTYRELIDCRQRLRAVYYKEKQKPLIGG